MVHPVPRRVEVSRFEGIESWLDAFDVEITVLFGNAIEFGLERSGIGLLGIERESHFKYRM